MTGDHRNAGIAADHVATLKHLPPDIVSATALFSDGELSAAEALVRPFLLKNPTHIEGMRLLARIGIARQVFDDAEVLLAAVLDLAPDYRMARFEYAQVLLDRHKYAQAIQQLERLLQVEPENRQFKTLYATASVGIGEHERALKLYRELLTDAPRPAELHLSIAHCLKTLGQRDASVDAYRSAAAARPDYGDAYWSLANLKTYRFTPQELNQMRVQEAAPHTSLSDRYHLCFALGKALEDQAEFAESFAYYERGNALKKSESDYRPEPIERNTRLQKETCTQELFAHRAGAGSPSADPIFIVGLPRSGSTLIEQILASHSSVEGTHELADIQRMAHEFQGRDPNLTDPRYPKVLTELPESEFLRLGEKYLRDTQVYRTGKLHFIDKMPNNFRHLGLIHLILPNAKIIDARREPMACCFSNLKQLFATGQEFTYSIEDIARYYRTYLELMQHWNQVLPGKILRLMHEEVVEDLEGNVRRLLQFCELEFEPPVWSFTKPNAAYAPRARNKYGNPFFERAWISGSTSSRILNRWRWPSGRLFRITEGKVMFRTLMACCLCTAACGATAATVYSPINATLADKTVVLTGKDLTINQVVDVARFGAKVALSPEARQRSRTRMNCCWKPLPKACRCTGSTAGRGSAEKSSSSRAIPARQTTRNFWKHGSWRCFVAGLWAVWDPKSATRKSYAPCSWCARTP